MQARKESVYEAIDQRCGGYPIENHVKGGERRPQNGLKINDGVKVSLGSHTEHCTTAKLSLTRKESVYEAINQRCGGYPIQNDEMRDERRGENSLKINDEVSLDGLSLSQTCLLANVFLNVLRIHVNLGAVYGLYKDLEGEWAL